MKKPIKVEEEDYTISITLTEKQFNQFQELSEAIKHYICLLIESDLKKKLKV